MQQWPTRQTDRQTAEGRASKNTVIPETIEISRAECSLCSLSMSVLYGTKSESKSPLLIIVLSVKSWRYSACHVQSEFVIVMFTPSHMHTCTHIHAAKCSPERTYCLTSTRAPSRINLAGIHISITVIIIIIIRENWFRCFVFNGNQAYKNGNNFEKLSIQIAQMQQHIFPNGGSFI